MNLYGWMVLLAYACLKEIKIDKFCLATNYEPLRLYFLLSSYQCQNVKCLLLAIVFCFAVIISCVYFVRRGLHISWYNLLSKPIVYVQYNIIKLNLPLQCTLQFFCYVKWAWYFLNTSATASAIIQNKYISIFLFFQLK
jgi:hypothetical protein